MQMGDEFLSKFAQILPENNEWILWIFYVCERCFEIL
jgi:hypothetical protein